MWLVVVVNHFYPSVFHFNNKEEAAQSYNKNKNAGYVTHLAKVELSNLEEDGYEFDYDFNINDLETLDSEWYTKR